MSAARRAAAAALVALSVALWAGRAAAHGPWIDAYMTLSPERPQARQPALLDVRLLDRLLGHPIIGARATFRARSAETRREVSGVLREVEAARYQATLRLPADGVWNVVLIVENLDEVVGGGFRVAVGSDAPALPPVRNLRDPLGWVPDEPVPEASAWVWAVRAALLLVGGYLAMRWVRRVSGARGRGAGTPHALGRQRSS